MKMELKTIYNENEDLDFITLNGEKYINYEDYQSKVDELEAMFGYECECNKDLVKIQNENERLKILLTNALTVLEENGFVGQSFCVAELGMTEEEYKNIMGDEE